ncbi:MAG: hypothetical protein HY721_22920 [Planctomycetes bacterium]|nr:hypothetical protein [Planctomycetota bacterium]
MRATPRRRGTSSLVIACSLALPPLGAGPPPELVWEIGRLDDKPSELALGAREEHPRFLERFPGEVRFAVGRSDPARDFPYIHPGTHDAWAGSKGHSFAIDFDLAAEPSGSYLLLVDLCRSHYGHPPVLAITVNGAKAGEVATVRDGRDQLHHLRLPEGALRRGPNELRIENATGSWAVYDGLRLERFPPGAPVERLTGLVLLDTPYLREAGGQLHQVIYARPLGLWDGKGVFRLKAEGFAREHRAEEVLLRPGLYELTIPPPAAPTAYACELATAAGTVASSEVQVSPHRKWTVFVAMKTHYDLGYTHPVDEMLRLAAGPMLEKVLEHAAATRDFAPEHRFRWIYPTWVLRKIRDLLPQDDRPRLDAAIRAGEVGWNAAPFSVHSYFCGMEDMVRAFYPSVRLEAELGKTVLWAKQTDVPGHTRFLPQVLARSGIRLLQIGANFGVRGQRTPLLFYWESPDGSRVLTQLTDGYGWGFDEGRMVALERDPAYPYDVFLALYVTGDNVGPADLVEVSRTAKALGERYAYPRFVIGAVEAFVDEVEARFADRVPVVKSELTDWWIHGVASMARETSLARRARERLTAAEKLWSLAAIAGSPRPYPAAEIDEAYEESLLFSEHTWGVSGFKPRPQPPEKRDLETNQDEGYRQMRRSWEVKGDYARKAWSIAEQTSRDGLEALAQSAGVPRGAVLVFNSLNWARSDLVRLPLAAGKGPPARVSDAASGAEVPWQLDEGDVVFLARDVPPVGHAAYLVEEAKAGDRAPEDRGGVPAVSRKGVLENARYRVTFDEAAGAVRSIVDRSSGEELVDPEASHRLGQYVYEGMEVISRAGWHGSPYSGKGTGSLVPRIDRVRVEEGPVLARFTAEGSLPIEGFPVEIGSVERVEQTVVLPRDLDWIECEVRLHEKRPTAVAEQGNVAFPFLVKDGKIRLELLGSVVDPEADLQEGGNRDSFAVQHWVDVSGPGRGVTWSPVDTTIVTLGALRLFHWDAAYVPSNTRIYANGLNNGWSTNFQEWQGGDFRFRFRLRSHAGGWLAGGAPRFGRETAQPLVAAVFSPLGPPGGTAVEGAAAAAPACRASHLLVEARHAVLVNLKRAEDRDGFVLRLFNPAGEVDAARVSFPSRPVRGAERVSATERPLHAPAGAAAPRLQVDGGAFTLPVGPFALETVRVRF